MKNKNVLLPTIKIICGLLFLIELGILSLINYFYFMQYLGCTMTPNPALKILCEAGAFMVFLLICLDIFLCYKALSSQRSKRWYAPLLVIVLGSQIMILFSISHANI